MNWLYWIESRTSMINACSRIFNDITTLFISSLNCVVDHNHESTVQRTISSTFDLINERRAL